MNIFGEKLRFIDISRLVFQAQLKVNFVSVGAPAGFA